MPAKATPYKQAILDDRWDAIVIGSGIGGLTAAVLLARHGGKRVLVLERHYEAGGFTHTFRRPGYEWDVGLHYVGEMEDERSTVRRAFDHVTARCGGSPCRRYTTDSSLPIRVSISRQALNAFARTSNNGFRARLKRSIATSTRFKPATGEAGSILQKRQFRLPLQRWPAA
jgi:all-trans-retinol 13,14-reductase